MFHVRALDPVSGVTLRQSTVSFPTLDAAKAAAAKLDRIHGDKHVVCESVDAKEDQKGFRVVADKK